MFIFKSVIQPHLQLYLQDSKDKGKHQTTDRERNASQCRGKVTETKQQPSRDQAETKPKLLSQHLGMSCHEAYRVTLRRECFQLV